MPSFKFFLHDFFLRNTIILEYKCIMVEDK